MGNSQSELRKYNAVLDDIQKQKINMDKELIRRNKEILRYILEQKILPELKKDILFNSLYESPYYTGSTYEGLRISAPTEFDINLILRLPFNYYKDLCVNELTKTYGTLSLTDDFDRIWHPNRLDYERYKNIKKYFLDKDEPRKFNACTLHKWFIRVMTKALQRMGYSICYNGINYDLKYSVKQTGPAHTLRVTTGYGEWLVFDVDLVPVFNFADQSIEHTKCKYLVPKRPKDLKWFDSKNVDQIFRFSYAPEECWMLDGEKNAKTVIKFLKLLRDEQGWSKIVSYHLKTIVMNLDFEEWLNERRLIEYLREAAESLEYCLRNHFLPMTHDEDYNLFEQIDNRTLDNMAGAVKKIIKDVKKDPGFLYTYLGANRTQKAASTQRQVAQSSHRLPQLSSDGEGLWSPNTRGEYGGRLQTRSRYGDVGQQNSSMLRTEC